MIDSIPKTHPRIILTDERVGELKSLLKTDAELQNLVSHLEKVGECILTQPPVKYRLDGVKRFRLLATSRQVLSRVLVLGTLHRLDGNEKWKTRLIAELKAVCAFKDWYPKHFLDTAEMSAAVAIGYDWLHNDMSIEERKQIREGLRKLGMNPGTKGGWWVTRDNNWNQVCHCGLTLTALALAHNAPDKADALLKSAKANFKHGLGVYAPAGIYPEGPVYWNYGTSFSVFMASALQSTLGTDWGLLDTPGFKQSFDYRMHVQSPTGKVINYADGGEGIASSPYHLYLASQTDSPGYSAFAMESLKKDYSVINDARYAKMLDRKVNRLMALAVAWYVPEKKTAKLPLDWFATEGNKQIHVAAMRSGWNDKKALFAGMKAGKLTVNHGHLDSGTFILESDGVRWASEFGSEKEIYDRSDTWSLKQDSHRWAYFRANNHGHNTLTIDNQLHRVAGSAPIIATAGGNSPFAIANLSSAFKGQATSVKRGLTMPGRKQFLVQDEVEGVPKGKSIRWNMITRTKVSLSEDKKTATLEYNKQVMTVSLLAPEGASFSTTDATTKLKTENQNKGFNRLIIDLESTGSPTTIAVQFTPGKTAGTPLEVMPLAEWKENK